MIIVMKNGNTEDRIEHAIKWVESLGFKAHPCWGVERTIIGVMGDDRGKAQLKSRLTLLGWKWSGGS